MEGGIPDLCVIAGERPPERRRFEAELRLTVGNNMLFFQHIVMVVQAEGTGADYRS